MPGDLNGRELANAAQALRPVLPVLFTSGYPDDELARGGELDPHVLLLVKFHPSAALAARLRAALRSAVRCSPRQEETRWNTSDC